MPENGRLTASLGKTSGEHAELKAKLDKLHAPGVVFAGCENTLSRMKIDRKELVKFATTVDSGVAEVVRKQAARHENEALHRDSRAE